MGLRGGIAAIQQYQRNVQDAQDWANMTEDALDDITQNVGAARDLLVQGSTDTTDQTARDSIASQMEQLIEAIKQGASKTYRGSYLFAGAATGTRPYVSGADDTYKGDLGGLDPAVPGIVREIGPGVTMTINTVGRDILGDGQAAGDGKLLNVLRDAVDHLKAGDGAGAARRPRQAGHQHGPRPRGARGERCPDAAARGRAGPAQQTEESTVEAADATPRTPTSPRP